ncbi:hypothetical protein BN159_7445 [Streptomyces davaonensis JCM 4913]|uniref:Uncharacterized protein n=1 Tax=Streptomyces davaonensis (strain DSM 101723 / JCM 4913 / KCC S-0913 / 768) TaxID=1214101 RepID=K4RFH3_STRDJ|nr:hypothetical protein [Streptomyces davaonensis]CCK31824.1 hypothetical protein BN159_7445 [Streptomyces davaonensis JCM 4913]
MPMPSLPPPGTFTLYPFAEPPLPAGRYTLSGEVAGLPGPVEPLPVTVDVVAPRYALPPDQVLGTFPPAGARGAFTSRLPQVVLRRRTLPWERSPDLGTAAVPTPWLALVLIAEGEGELKPDVAVEQCVTPGVALGAERDVPKGSCLVVPRRVVDLVFPTREDLALLTHVREVDLLDTELAMGDDDGWMAVVLGNRLPQPGIRYLACLISLEGQWNELPPPVPAAGLGADYRRIANVLDLGVLAAEEFGPRPAADVSTMRLPGSGADRVTQAPSARAAASTGADHPAGPAVRSATGKAVPSGSGWASTQGGPAASLGSGAITYNASGSADPTVHAKAALGDGFTFAAELAGQRTLRFPVLAHWSFRCEERGDFQYLAQRITSRLLGHMAADPEVPDTPDGDPAPAGGPDAPGAVPEPGAGRPLPLVAETGHVLLDAVTRRGDGAQAWFRGPLSPSPVERATTRPVDDGRPPLAHHADQLRRVTPDGREDLGYAAAFELGRLLALSRPGVAAALGRWRQEAYGAARGSGMNTEGLTDLPDDLRAEAERPAPFTDDRTERIRSATVGRRAARAVLGALGDDPGVLAPSRPLADPADSDDLRRLLDAGRDEVVLRGLGLIGAGAGGGLDGVDLRDAPAVADALAVLPPQVAGARDREADRAALRHALETEAARLAADAEELPRFGTSTEALQEEER